MLFLRATTLYSQEGGSRVIDSVMAISPLYMPVSYTQIEPHFFSFHTYRPVDTAIDRVQNFDYFYNIENIYQQLGMPAQAHRNMAFNYVSEGTFSLINLPYPLYFKQQNELDFYDLKTSFTSITYAFTLTQRHTLHAVYAQKIKGVTFSANIDGFMGKGDFVNQRCDFFSVDGIVHYELPSKIYGFKLSYIFNRTMSPENNGLHRVDTSEVDRMDYYYFISGKKKTPNGQPITSGDYQVANDYAHGKVLTHDILLQQYVNLNFKGKKRDFSLGSVTHTFQFKNLQNSYLNPLYVDSLGNAASSPTDTLMDSLRFYTVINTLQWSTYSLTDKFPAKKYFFHFAGGVMHEYSHIGQWRFKNNSYTLFGRTNIRLFSVMDIYGQISYSFLGYLHNNAIARASVSWAINRKKQHFLGVKANYYRESPNYIFSYYSGSELQWSLEHQKQNIFNMEAFWTRDGIKASFNYFLLDNYVKFDSDLMPLVCDDFINVLQIRLYTPFRIKGFGVNSNLYLQYSNHEYLSLPLFAGKATFYYIFKLFKRKMDLQIGTDLMYNTNHYADGYAPVLHQFYNQNEVQTGNYLYLGIYLNLKIERISAFVRFDNLLVGALPNRYMMTPYHPMDGRKLSVGVNWKFYD